MRIFLGRLYCNTFNRAAYRSDDYGKTWKKIKGYDFHWGHRVVVDNNDPENIYITTFGSSMAWKAFSRLIIILYEKEFCFIKRL